MTASTASTFPRLLPVLAAALLLAGCFGFPPGTIRPGDSVTLKYTATDLATGQVLAQDATATFVAGSGASGLGHDLERAVIGHKANDTFTLDSRGDTGRAFDQTVEVSQLFDSRAVVQHYDTANFTKALGTPRVGMNFTAYGYNATLTDVNPSQVTFRLAARDGLRQEFPDFGLTMVYSTQGGNLVKVLEPTPGKVFTIGFAGQIALRAINADGTTAPLPAGTYKVLPATGGNLRFSHSAGTAAALLGRDVAFTATIVSVAPGTQAPLPVTGEYGHRSSPQLQGDPRTALGLPPTATAAPSG